MSIQRRRDYEDDPEGYEPIEINKHYDNDTIDFAIDNFDSRIAALEEIHEYNNSIAGELNKRKLKLDRKIVNGEEKQKINRITSGKKSANSIRPSR